MYSKSMKTEKGITLLVLVITIIILVILATISINAVIGDNGLIQSAKNSKNSAENAVEQETGKMNSLLTEYANIMAEDTEIIKPGDDSETPNPGGDTPGSDGDEDSEIDETIVEPPQLVTGMIPVKWNESTKTWIKTEETDAGWYNYGEKKWANIVLGDATFSKVDGKEVLDETQTYSMLVWIPRYAYKITSYYHLGGDKAGNIEIVFLDRNNKSKTNEDFSNRTTYPSVTNSGKSTGRMNDYVVHPAFTYGDEELAGFWAGKFETSQKTDGTIQITGGVSSLRGLTIGEYFAMCLDMNSNNNTYGISSSDSVVDPHMMKNTEWGAVVYLSQSIYGKNEIIEMNDNNSFVTGGGDYKSNVEQSSTGNVWGVYDLVGGSFEYVAAYINDNSSINLTKYGSELRNADEKYVNIYKKGSSYNIFKPTQAKHDNYLATEPQVGKKASESTGYYGDAIWETSSDYNSENLSWNKNASIFSDGLNPFLIRGGGITGQAEMAGTFYFNEDGGYDNDNNDNDNNEISFRVVIPVI